MARDVVGADCGTSPGFARGDFGLVRPLPFALGFRKGDAVRLIAGGVCVRDGGLLGRLMDGLSHEEKKSSSLGGVSIPSVVAETTISVITTSSGKSLASAATLLLSSSLYFVAAFDVYFVFGSLLASAAVPPCDWKYFVADSFPPTFMIRSWSHCHSVPLTSEHYGESAR